jgi:hypothetical protein
LHGPLHEALVLYQQVFVLNGTSGGASYAYMQDLATLNMPAGQSTKLSLMHFMLNNTSLLAP